LARFILIETPYFIESQVIENLVLATKLYNRFFG